MSWRDRVCAETLFPRDRCGAPRIATIAAADVGVVIRVLARNTILLIAAQYRVARERSGRAGGLQSVAIALQNCLFSPT